MADLLAAKTWWSLDREEAPIAAWSLAEQMRRKRNERMAECADYLALYEGTPSNGLGASQVRLPGMLIDVPGYNVVQSILDTLASRVLKNRVRVMFLTEGGNAEEQRRAQGMSRAVEAEFDRVGLYGALGSSWFYDGGIFGDGILKISPDYQNKRVNCERAWPWDLFVGDRDGHRGTPRQLCHTTTVDRAVLAEMFADAGSDVQEAIANAQAAPYEATGVTSYAEPTDVADHVLVTELWHLPSGRVDRKSDKAWGIGADERRVKANHDGRRMLLVDGKTALIDEPWPFEYFPLPRFQYQARTVGWYGRGVAERQLGVQLALNRMLRRVDGIMNLHARPLVYVDRRAKVNISKINNAWANIIEGNGQGAIQYITPQSVPAEYIAQIERLKNWAYMDEGISEMTVTAERPAGIEAAVALQQLEDQQSIRLTTLYQHWDQAHLDAARCFVDAIRMLAKHDPNYSVIWGDAKDLKAIKWGDVDLDDARWHLRRWPTNLLPQTPAAKKAAVIELKNEGFISMAQAKAELDYPDMEANTADELAARRNIERKIDDIVLRGRQDVIPHGYMDLALAETLGTARINQLEADGLEDDAKTELLRRFVSDVKDLIKQAAEAAKAEMGADAGPQARGTVPTAAVVGAGNGAAAPGPGAMPS